VRLSETHHLLCEGPDDYDDDAEMNCHVGEVLLELCLRGSNKWYCVRMFNVVGKLRPGSDEREFNEAPDLVTLLLQMVARDARAGCEVRIYTGQRTTAPVAGVVYLRSVPNGPRVVLR
jgi:hypothetical protein